MMPCAGNAQYRFPVPVVVTTLQRLSCQPVMICETCGKGDGVCLNMTTCLLRSKGKHVGRVVGCSDGGPARFRRRCVPRNPRTTQALTPRPDSD